MFLIDIIVSNYMSLIIYVDDWLHEQDGYMDKSMENMVFAVFA